MGSGTPALTALRAYGETGGSTTRRVPSRAVLLREWIGPAEVRESCELAIAGTDLAVVFDGESGQMGVRRGVTGGPGLGRERSCVFSKRCRVRSLNVSHTGGEHGAYAAPVWVVGSSFLR